MWKIFFNIVLLLLLHMVDTFLHIVVQLLITTHFTWPGFYQFYSLLKNCTGHCFLRTLNLDAAKKVKMYICFEKNLWHNGRWSSCLCYIGFIIHESKKNPLSHPVAVGCLLHITVFTKPCASKCMMTSNNFRAGFFFQKHQSC